MVTSRQRDSPRAIYRRRKKDIAFWETITTESLLFKPCAVLKLNPDIKRSTLYRRLKEAKKQREITGNAQAVPTFLMKNVHKQIFTSEQELILANNIRNIIGGRWNNVDKDRVREMAIDYYIQLNPAQCRSKRGTNALPFTASEGWISRFKARHNFKKRAIEYKQTPKTSVVQDRENDKYAFVCMIEEAVDNYGADYVFNMDETPAKLCEPPRSGWATDDMDKITLGTLQNSNKKKITIMPTITVSGKKLKFAWINDAKTNREIFNMFLPAHINSYFSQKGWIVSSIMLEYLRQIVKPYLNGKPGALIVDDYGAHWTPEVRNYAAEIKLELIPVPPGCTDGFQPLDISVNGPMKRKRQRIAVEQRYKGVSVLDSKQETVLRASQAYDEIDKKCIISGWIQACPPLERIFKPANPNTI